jgi:uncharacterized protein YyaL (SSP411 family)
MRLLAAAAACMLGCTTAIEPPPAAGGLTRPGTPAEVDVAKARQRGRAQLFEWADWSAETFERARREGRLLLVHGAAEWCHWCHVMEATTYRDPEVGALLRDGFVAVRVDVDSRPDIEERYEDWGWPATVILSSDAQELGKYRGYLPPAEMLGILRTAKVARTPQPTPLFPAERAAAVEALPFIGAHYAHEMDAYYDEREGGWGMRQKAPVGENAVFEIRRHRRGDPGALARALFSHERQAALIDPVWGGIYQYSAGKTWKQPHYEKLMTYQAANLWAYADAYAQSGDARMLAHERAIAGYLDRFLSGPDGAFYVSQDADVGAHDPAARFVDGDVYYRLGDAERRRLGMPRIDDHVYAEENGLAIAALAALHDATGDATVLARAERAASRVLASHVDAGGRVVHDAEAPGGVHHLADAAVLGFALARLGASSADGARFREAAAAIARFLEHELLDTDGAFWGHTPDPNAFGVFAQRRKPFLGNVYAARLFAAIGGDDGLAKARRTLAAISRPDALRERGRMIGIYLVALDEAGALAW